MIGPPQLIFIFIGNLPYSRSPRSKTEPQAVLVTYSIRAISF